MAEFRVTPKAQQDLEKIWQYSVEAWSLEQADAYVDSLFRAIDTLVSMPFLARERSEFTPPVRIHPSGRHLIIYQVDANYLLVIRVLGGQQDWQAVLGQLAN